MADSIKVNAAQWQALSTSDRDKVTQILKESGLLRDATITPDAATPAFAAAAGFLPESVCKALCGVGEAAAVAACAGLTGGIAIAACVAAAHAAADFCRSKC